MQHLYNLIHMSSSGMYFLLIQYDFEIFKTRVPQGKSWIILVFSLNIDLFV